MNGSIITFTFNKVKRIQTSQKRMMSFEYLRSYVTSNKFVFLQETHSSIGDEKKWEIQWHAFFSHGTIICGVLLALM